MTIAFDFVIACAMFLLVIIAASEFIIPNSVSAESIFLFSIFWLVMTILTFTVLRPMRYYIAFPMIAVTSLYLTILYLFVGRPYHKAGGSRKTEYYGRQIQKQLQDYQIVWCRKYGIDSFPKNAAKKQAYLFLDNQTYKELIHEQEISQVRWEIIKLLGKPDVEFASSITPTTRKVRFNNLLYIVLILDRPSAPSIALPFYSAFSAGFNPNSSLYYYLDSNISYIALKTVESDAELTVFSYKKWPSIWHDPITYFYEHIIEQPHTRLMNPSFTEHEKLSFFRGHYAQREQSTNSRPESEEESLKIYDADNNPSSPTWKAGITEYAAKLSQLELQTSPANEYDFPMT